MARYTVRAEAVSASTTLGPGLVGVNLVVQVHDEAGEPVTGLPKSSFRVFVYQGGTFGNPQLPFHSEPLSDTDSTHLPGIYAMRPDWAIGEHVPDAVFVVHVRSPRGFSPLTTGEALCKLVRGRE